MSSTNLGSSGLTMPRPAMLMNMVSQITMKGLFSSRNRIGAALECRDRVRLSQPCRAPAVTGISVAPKAPGFKNRLSTVPIFYNHDTGQAFRGNDHLMKETVTLEAKELKKLMALNKVGEKWMGAGEVAEILGLSVRHVRRLLAGYRREILLTMPILRPLLL